MGEAEANGAALFAEIYSEDLAEDTRRIYVRGTGFRKAAAKLSKQDRS